jgi:quercetin dioxygenase-like cupin family protein
MGTLASSKLQVKRGNAPDESRPFAGKGQAEIHKIGNGSVMHGVFEPGWKWSEHIAPIAQTKSCQAPHLGYVVSGRMRIRMEDGTEEEMGPGDFFKISPGHDAWVVGNERCVLVDFAGYENYAKPGVGVPRADDRASTTERSPGKR